MRCESNKVIIINKNSKQIIRHQVTSGSHIYYNIISPALFFTLNQPKVRKGGDLCDTSVGPDASCDMSNHLFSTDRATD